MNELHELMKSFFGFSQHYDFDDSQYGFNDDRYYNQDDDIADDIFSMHGYMKHINEIITQFGLPSFPNDQFHADIFDENFPPNNSLRSKLLKPGFETTCSDKRRPDLELSNRFPLDIKESEKPTGSTSFSKSYITRTIRQPDGTYVTEKITRDNKGNEEKTVTYHDGKDGKSPDDHDGLGPFRFSI